MKTILFPYTTLALLLLISSPIWAILPQSEVYVPARIEIKNEVRVTTEALDFGPVSVPFTGTVVSIDLSGNVQATNGATVFAGSPQPGAIIIESTNANTPIQVRPYLVQTALPMVAANSNGVTLTLNPILYSASGERVDGVKKYTISPSIPYQFKVIGQVTLPASAPAGIYNCTVPVTLYWE